MTALEPRPTIIALPTELVLILAVFQRRDLWSISHDSPVGGTPSARVGINRVRGYHDNSLYRNTHLLASILF